MEWIHVLSIVLPIVLALVIGFFFNNSRFDDVNQRFEDVNQRFEDVNQRFQGVDKRFDDLNRRIDDLRIDFNQRFNILHEDVREIKNLLIDFLKKEAGYTLRDK
ncbi:MAG TPA: hypothetical protein ENN22_02915 [bacterium]|nr:hypothetical protein [bacterium]